MKARARNESQSTAEPPSWRCCVYGCSRAGAIAENTTGPSDKWFCRWHFGEPPARWSDITEGLRRTDEPSGPTTSKHCEDVRRANAEHRQRAKPGVTK